MVLWLWVLNSIFICPQCEFVLFVIFCKIPFLYNGLSFGETWMSCTPSCVKSACMMLLVIEQLSLHYTSLFQCSGCHPEWFWVPWKSTSLARTWLFSVVLLKKAFTICCSLDWQQPDFAHTLRPLWQGWVLLPEFQVSFENVAPCFGVLPCGREWLFCIRLLGGCYCVLTPGWVCFVWPHVCLIDSISIIL